MIIVEEKRIELNVDTLHGLIFPLVNNYYFIHLNYRINV